MVKAGLLATALVVAASTAAVEGVVFEPLATPGAAAPCQTAACAARAADTDGDGTISPAELANLAVAPAPVADWTALHPASATGLDFKDAATEPGPVLPASLDSERSKPLIPALFALGGLVILLRRRPT